MCKAQVVGRFSALRHASKVGRPSSTSNSSYRRSCSANSRNRLRSRLLHVKFEGRSAAFSTKRARGWAGAGASAACETERADKSRHTSYVSVLSSKILSDVHAIQEDAEEATRFHASRSCNVSMPYIITCPGASIAYAKAACTSSARLKATIAARSTGAGAYSNRRRGSSMSLSSGTTKGPKNRCVDNIYVAGSYASRSSIEGVGKAPSGVYFCLYSATVGGSAP